MTLYRERFFQSKLVAILDFEFCGDEEILLTDLSYLSLSKHISRVNFCDN